MHGTLLGDAAHPLPLGMGLQSEGVGLPLRMSMGAIHIIQRAQCTVGVQVNVQALHKQFSILHHRRSLPSTLAFRPGLGAGGLLAVLCPSCFVSASAVLTAVVLLLGPC